MTKARTMPKSYFHLVENFTKQTTVHGLYITGLPKLHILERLFWLVIVMTAAGGAIAIAYSNWIRYQANPTVVSLQKDFRNWQNPFPAVTGCFMDKTDKKKVDLFIQKTWGVNSYSDILYDYYKDFINVVANVSYDNLKYFNKFTNDTYLQNINMLEIAMQVHPKLSGTLVTFDTKHKTDWTLIISEMGICFSVNALFVNLLSLNKYRNTKSQTQRILRCHYLNGLCYARYDSDPEQPLKYYVHSYLDVVHATMDPPLVVHESEELEINYRMQETESSLALRDLKPSQRKCRFHDEPVTSDMPVFSSSICYIQCRYKLAMELCGCKPFFYHNLFEGKVCNISGLVCLSKFAEYITQPPTQIGCKCPEPCDIILYFPQVPKFTKWEYGYFEQRLTFRWGLLPPTTKFHRDVLFGFEDLVVSFGGTLALFLGISFISAIEFIFLLVENIFIYLTQKNVIVVTPH